MRPSSQHAITVVFLIFLFSQALAFALGSRAKPFENRPLAEFPQLSWSGFTDDGTTGALSAYLRDRLPLRPPLIAAHNWVLYSLFRDSPVEQVRIGKDGWLFLANTIESLPCSRLADPERVIPRYDDFIEAARAAGKLPLVVLSPEKAAMYPEFLADRDRKRFAACAEPRRARLERHFDRNRHYLNLWGILRQEKQRLLAEPAENWQEERLRYLYRPRDRHWHLETGRLQALAIVERIAPGQESRTPWPALTSPYRPMWSEMSKRFLKFGLMEPYVRLASLPAGLKKTAIRIPGSNLPIVEFTSSDPNADPRRVAVVHDSFIFASDEFLAVNFARVDFIHWESVKDVSQQVGARILDADVIVLQTVDSQRGEWGGQVKQLTKLLQRNPVVTQGSTEALRRTRGGRVKAHAATASRPESPSRR